MSLALWALLFSFYALTGSGHSGFGDGYLLFRTARNLLDHGSFAIDPVPGAGNLAQRSGVDGRFYAIFAPGLAFADIPMIALGRRLPAFLQPAARGEPWDALQCDEFWSSFTNAWVTATTVVLVWLCGVKLGFSWRVSLANALLLAVASPLWCYARTDSSEALQGLLFVAAVLALPDENAVPQSLGVFFSGGLLALAIIVKLANAAVIPWFALYVISAPGALRERLRSCVALIAAPAAALLAHALYDFVRFGSPLDVGYKIDPRLFSEPLLSGISVLLFSVSNGVLFFWPPALMSLLGARRFAASNPRTAMLVLAVFITLLRVYATNWAFWQFAWGPRYLVPAIPLVALLALPVLSHRGWVARSAVALAAVLGVGVQAITTGASWWHQVFPIYHAVSNDGILERMREPRLAPLRIGAWWIGLVTAEHWLGPAHAAVELVHPPWEDRFPWRQPDTALSALWDVRGLDLWAAPSAWRMPYRPIGRTSVPLTPIPSNGRLRIGLAVAEILAAAVLVRESLRVPPSGQRGVATSPAPCLSPPDVS